MRLGVAFVKDVAECVFHRLRVSDHVICFRSSVCHGALFVCLVCGWRCVLWELVLGISCVASFTPQDSTDLPSSWCGVDDGCDAVFHHARFCDGCGGVCVAGSVASFCRCVSSDFVSCVCDLSLLAPWFGFDLVLYERCVWVFAPVCFWVAVWLWVAFLPILFYFVLCSVWSAIPVFYSGWSETFIDFVSLCLLVSNCYFSSN